MKVSLILETGLRYLFGKGPNSAESLRRIRGGVLGIALSLVPLVLVFEMASGMIEGISARFLETWSYHGQFSAQEFLEASELVDAGETLEASGLVAFASPEVRGTGLLRGVDGSKPVLIRGVVPGALERDGSMMQYLEVHEGGLDLTDGQSMVLGRALADSLGVELGTKVRLLTYAGSSWTGLPRLSTFTVVGIVSSGYQDLDKMWAFVNLEKASRVLSQDNSYQFIGIKIRDPYQIDNPLSPPRGAIGTDAGDFPDWPRFRRALVETLEGSNRETIRTWLGTSWYESQRLQLEHFEGTRSLLLIIMVLIVLVASVNVSSTMILLVLEKQEDLAMLRSLGAGPWAIGGLFIFMGLWTGLLGAILGLTFGAILALMVNEVIGVFEKIINFFAAIPSWIASLFGLQGGTTSMDLELLNPEFYLERIPVQLHVWELFGVFLLVLVLSVLASVVPAVRAARLRPVEIMRKV